MKRIITVFSLPTMLIGLAASAQTQQRASGDGLADRFDRMDRNRVLFEAITATWPRGTGSQPVTASPSKVAPGATIELTLKGKAQPRGYEIWGLIDGKWFYRETTK